MEEKRKGNFIGTYRGGKFWVGDPRKEDVDLIAIFHALSHICRYNGHTRFMWTVGQHSLLVERIMSDGLGYYGNYRMRLLALLHDASEAYITDIVRPLKEAINGYEDIEKEVQRVIMEKAGLGGAIYDEQIIIDEADDIALSLEAYKINKPDEMWNLERLRGYERTFGDGIQKEDPLITKGRLIMKYGELAGELGLGIPWENEAWWKEMGGLEGAIPILDYDKYRIIQNYEGNRGRGCSHETGGHGGRGQYKGKCKRCLRGKASGNCNR